MRMIPHKPPRESVRASAESDVACITHPTVDVLFDHLKDAVPFVVSI